MPHTLVIVESSAKCKTIQKYLNHNDKLKSNGPYKVVASLGHIVDLPPKELGVNTETWELSYETIRTKSKVVKQLKEEVKEASDVYLATDPDREGEAIAWHLKKRLGLTSPKRVLFHEITPKALEIAMLHPTVIDEEMVEAQESRRALDRMVGFKVSPLLWHRFTSPGLSAGRVQSVVLRNVVEKFQNYEKHIPESFWTMEGIFEINKISLQGDLVSKGTQKKIHFEEPSLSLKILEIIQQHLDTHWSISYELKTSHTNPSPPFTTSALQQEAYETYKIPAKSTMQLAQKLYEEGHITYMRTDSVNISKEAHENMKQYISTTYTEADYENRIYKSKVANAQEAHECIRPTKMSQTASGLDENMTPSHRKIYDLIWRRTIASQMIAATYVDVIYRIQSKLPILSEYEFYGKISLLQEPGYLKVWMPKQLPSMELIEEWKKRIAGASRTTSIHASKVMSKGNITKPEGLYNEAGVVRWMEKEGIGRPSTYATIVDKLFDKGYITKGANPLQTESIEHYILENKEISTQEETLQFGGNEKDRFIPTALGVNVYTYLIEHLPSILNYKFTSQLEESLDEISRKENTKKDVLTKFYQELEPIIEKELQAMKEYRSTNKKEKTEKKALAPKASNVLKEFPSENMQLIQTRYGPALFHTTNKNFVSVQPFIQWKKIEIEQLATADVTFLKKFPIHLNEQTTIDYGRYGIYLTHNKKNIRLPKTVWESVYNGTYTSEEIIRIASV